jgi:hypothetical protein
LPPHNPTNKTKKLCNAPPLLQASRSLFVSFTMAHLGTLIAAVASQEAPSISDIDRHLRACVAEGASWQALLTETLAEPTDASLWQPQLTVAGRMMRLLPTAAVPEALVAARPVLLHCLKTASLGSQPVGLMQCSALVAVSASGMHIFFSACVVNYDDEK